ncbi:MAG: alpha/beta fold hydrolase [FCB group bacterium]|jgi:dienelactone hydrolase|nr:alpha/beta fold hydrolase [FCB group bacterium]
MKRKILIGALATGFTLIVTLLVVKVFADSRFYAGYDAALPLNAEVQPATVEDGFKRVAFYYDSVPGERVPGVMALPKTGDGPFPCIIFLHGIGQSKGFLDEVAKPFADAGFALVSFDQYMRGERRITSKNPLVQASAFRRRGALTVIDTRRLIDYLVTRPDIAKDRIYLVGASYGAITGATAVAFEPRIKAAVLTYGGGRLPLLLDSNAASSELGMFSGPLAYIGAFFLSPSDPEKYVGRISPRPLLFQNGVEDSLVPAASAIALQNAANDPKDIVWYEGDHVGFDEEATSRVLNDALKWIMKHDKTGAKA